MQQDIKIKPEVDAEPNSPASASNALPTKEGVKARTQSTSKSASSHNVTTNGQFPPPKTDKPRPHVCGTCGRSFARLEHLKRHERSHTKEKPFECPECTRCFARRDLLLRHQQKLHMTGSTSSRPRSGRRESVSSASVATGRVRKNSIANANNASVAARSVNGHRPRANTISHIDLSSLGLLEPPNPSFSRLNALGISAHPMTMAGPQGSMNFDYRGMSTAMGQHGNLHNLPKLNTHSVNHLDVTNSLRTAPPHASFGGFDVDQLFNPGTTINPAQLHFGGSVSSTQANFPPLEPFTVRSATDPQAQHDDFGWMRTWNMQTSYDGNEQAIEESSPSRMSSGDSPAEFNDNFTNPNPNMHLQHMQWAQQEMQAQQSIQGGPFQLDALGSGLPALDTASASMLSNSFYDTPASTDTFLSPQLMQQQHQHTLQQSQQTAQDLMAGQSQMQFAPSISNFSSDSPGAASSTMTGSARQSSVTSVSTDSITDATRQALLMSLSQPSCLSGHGHRKFSQPNVSSPLSPGAGRSNAQMPNLPSTADIRRYVEAFIHHAHPHLPVTHIPTLSFDAVEYSTSIKTSPAYSHLRDSNVMGGGGCLILGMAAIGALYEYDHPASKELFEAAKKLITLYLEERRKADLSAALNGANSAAEIASNHTPLWLVQAMLLNVIYGHQCGDKTSADIASNQCAALVSLARAAQLAQSPSGRPADCKDHQAVTDRMDTGDGSFRQQTAEGDIQAQWLAWKDAEERKRTLFAIFILSSLLTTAYNQTPTIMNSEILLDLPCDEELWSAETALEWHQRGGFAAAEQNAVSFAGALGTLLTANQRQGSMNASMSYNSNNPLGALQAGDGFADSDLRPSTFGCLVLINALHNYIWETRSRHHGRQWTSQETESMFSHIEPALNAWQAAWKANDHHKYQRPNLFGLGPLSADSIPLLDLAFVRLFVNLGRSKEAFWQRDFDAMADELARGAEIVQHAEPSPSQEDEAKEKSVTPSSSHDSPEDGSSATRRRPSQAVSSQQACSRRERHLRKAAFYAADSLMMSCTYNLTYADQTAHELPIQSAMCFFDCSQVLAEWASTVQERVGGYLGVLGREQIDFTQFPAIMLLESEDVELLRKIELICDHLEAKRHQQENLLAIDLPNMSTPASMSSSMHSNVNLSACGYGSKILRITAMMLEKAVIWPVTHVMGKALETQAAHMDRRADASVRQ